MNSEPFASAAKLGTREITAELDDLKRKVDRLSQILKQRTVKQSGQAASSDEKTSQLGMLQQGPVSDV